MITTATPTRYDFSISLDKSIRNHRFLFAIQHANETYQSYDVLDSQGVDTLTSSIFQSNQKKNVNEYSIVITDKFKAFNLDFVIGSRLTQYLSYNWETIPSISIRKEFNGFNRRLNYSRGYSIPSIKALYYDFPDHPMMPLYGN